MAPPTKAFRFLPPQTSVYDLSDLCRDAALELVAGASSGWGRSDVVAWSDGPYRGARAALAHLSAPAATRSVVQAISAERTLLEARDEALALIQACATSWECASAARDLLASGVVVGVRDRFGSLGYCPLGGEGLSLGTRVVSLLVADYMTRPADYRSVLVCDHCGRVSFSWAAVHAEDCAPQGASGVVPKQEAHPTFYGDLARAAKG
jgi:hypothetical protein